MIQRIAPKYLFAELPDSERKVCLAYMSVSRNSVFVPKSLCQIVRRRPAVSCHSLVSRPSNLLAAGGCQIALIASKREIEAECSFHLC
jgi:hypothetical protein